MCGGLNIAVYEFSVKNHTQRKSTLYHLQGSTFQIIQGFLLCVRCFGHSLNYGAAIEIKCFFLRH